MTDNTKVGDSYEHDFVPPCIAFGSQIGINIPNNIRKRIKNNDYIDFLDLIPNWDPRHEDEHLSLQLDTNNAPVFVKKVAKKTMTYFQWSAAFDIFIIIYLQEHKSITITDQTNLIRELFTYRKHIGEILKQDGDWLSYDKHFRSEIKDRGDSWSTVRFDLQMFYNINKKTEPTKPVVFQKSRSNANFTKGHCVLYNSRSERCENNNCIYKHICQKCDGPHPVFLCGKFTIPNRRESAFGNKYVQNAAAQLTTKRLQQPTSTTAKPKQS